MTISHFNLIYPQIGNIIAIQSNLHFIVMECPMCYDLYDHSEKIPRNLNCGHTACQECLNYAYDKKKMLECPTCRFKHQPQLRPNMLTKNYIALQLASQKKEMRKNHQFCPDHDEPFKFYCQDDNKYICVQCIVDHTGHRFAKQDQNFFMAKKSLSQQLARLQQEKAVLLTYQDQFDYVKNEMITKYEDTIGQIDRMFSVLKNRIVDQHHKSKQEIQKFLEKEIAGIQDKEKQITQDLDYNGKQRVRLASLLQKIEKERKISNQNLQINNEKPKDYKRPMVVQFPVCITPFTGEENFVQIYHKTAPKICFFGERKKLLTLCPITGVYTLTTIANAQIQYYGSACTLPTGQIIITGGGSSNHCFLFNPRDPNVLQRKKNMMFARKEHSCVYLKNNVYVISGYDGKNKGMAGCEAYDIFRQEWRNVKSLNTPRCAFAATVCEGKIYIFGGYDGKDRLNSIEVFNPDTYKWTLLSTTLKFPLSNAAAVAQGKNIYIFGGGWSQGFNQEIFKFNVDTHQLISFQKMHKGRDLRNKAIKYKNQIYAIGGNFYDGEKLDLRTGKWEQLKGYNDLVNDNLDSWCCALAYNSQEYQMQKCEQLRKALKKQSESPFSGISGSSQKLILDEE